MDDGQPHGRGCRQRWGWSKTHANRQAEAANTAKVLTPIGVTPTNEAQAPDLTERIKAHSGELWHLLLKAYERGAHAALGYGSWGAYFQAEFGGRQRRGYRLIDAGRVMRAIEGRSPIGERPTDTSGPRRRGSSPATDPCYFVATALDRPRALLGGVECNRSPQSAANGQVRVSGNGCSRRSRRFRNPVPG
jgi:hypothetical protein